MAHGWKWKRIWDPVFLGRIVLRYRIDLLRRIFSWIRTWVWTNYDAGSSSQLVCHFLRVQSGTQGGPKPPPTSITTFLHHIVTYRQRKHQAIDPILLFLPLSLLLLRTYVLTVYQKPISTNQSSDHTSRHPRHKANRQSRPHSDSRWSTKHLLKVDSHTRSHTYTTGCSLIVLRFAAEC